MAKNLGKLGKFTPSDDCTDAFSDVYVQSDGGTVFAGPVATASCFPDKYDLGLSAYYTGATECPRGYTAACSQVLTQGSKTETAVTCCPHPNDKTTFACYGEAKITDIEPVGCFSQWTEDVTYPVVTFMTMVDEGAPKLGPLLSEFLVGSIGAINAYSIQIRFHESDISKPPIQTRSSTSTTDVPTEGITASASRPTDISPVTPTSQPPDEPNELPEPPHIDPGTVAGVTVTTFVVFIIFGVFFFRTRKKKDKEEQEPSSSKNDDGESSMSDEEKRHAKEMDVPPTWTELEGGERPAAELVASIDRPAELLAGTAHPAELLANTKHPTELQALDRPAELHGVNRPAEMLAGTRHPVELFGNLRYPVEMLANTRHPVELAGGSRPTELAAVDAPVELPAYPYNRYSKNATRASRTWYGRRSGWI